MSPSSIATKNRNVLINLSTLLLHDAFADPDKITDLLEFQMTVRIEANEVELRVKAIFEKTDLIQIEGIIDGHLLTLHSHIKHTAVHPVLLQGTAQTVHILGIVQRLNTFRV